MSASNDSSDNENSDWTIVDKQPDEEELDSETVTLESGGSSEKRDENDIPAANNNNAIPNLNNNNGDEGDVIDYDVDDREDFSTSKDSFHSHISQFSMINRSDIMDAEVESLGSGASSISVIPDENDLHVDYSNLSSVSSAHSKFDEEYPKVIENVSPIRSYSHVPNRNLNGTLNFVVVLSITLVVGLGLGHFLGWSSKKPEMDPVQLSHVVKMRAIQDELLSCIQRLAVLDETVIDDEARACINKINHWTEASNDLDPCKLIDDKLCANEKDLVNAYEALKTNLQSRTEAYRSALNKIEDIQLQEMQSRDRVHQLEAENEELRALVEEEDSASETVSEMVSQLKAENQELRDELQRLQREIQIESSSKMDAVDGDREMGTLRQQMNQLQVENADLRYVIARIRYVERPLQQATPVEEPTPESRDSRAPNGAENEHPSTTASTERGGEEAAMDEEGPEGFGYVEWIMKQKIPGAGSVGQLLGWGGGDAEEGKDRKPSAVRATVEAFNAALEHKWREMAELKNDIKNAPVVQKMERLLKDGVNKLQKIDARDLHKIPEKINEMLGKVSTHLEKKWGEIKQKFEKKKKPKNDNYRAEDEKSNDGEAPPSKHPDKEKKMNKENENIKNKKRYKEERGENQKNDGDDITGSDRHDDNRHEKAKRRGGKNQKNGREDVEVEDKDNETKRKEGKNKKEKKNSRKNEETRETAEEQKKGKKKKENGNGKKKMKEEKYDGNSKNETEMSGEWVFKRAKDREDTRKEKQRGDWYFDRQVDREEKRNANKRSENNNYLDDEEKKIKGKKSKYQSKNKRYDRKDRDDQQDDYDNEHYQRKRYREQDDDDDDEYDRQRDDEWHSHWVNRFHDYKKNFKQYWNVISKMPFYSNK